MCALAVIALCIAHPGLCFEQMRGNYAKKIEEEAVLLESKTAYNNPC